MESVIKQALSHVIDPDLKKDIITLNMVKDINVQGHEIKFTFVLTTPVCPLKEQLRQDCIDAIHKHVGENYSVDIEFTSQVTTQRKDNFAQLEGIKNIIAVASGKGGVGKSTIAANLAIQLAAEGAKVGLLDTDIHGPSVPLLFDLENAKPKVEEAGKNVKMFPIEKHGVKLNSVGFLVPSNQALVWRGPMLSSALKQLFLDTVWGELDYLIIDMPPGTGDIHLTLSQQFPLTAAIVVTSPQEISLIDARKCVEMFQAKQIEIPILGVVENMSYFTPAELPEKRYYLFGKGGGEKLAAAYGVPLLGQVPMILEGDEENPQEKALAFSAESPLHPFAQSLAQKVAQQVAIQNAAALAT